MAWQALDRITPVVDEKAPAVLSDAIREKIRSYFPRYETKRAALLPALHVVQDALGHVSPKAMLEIAEVLEIPPSQVLDTMSFYTHFWDHPKGRKVVVACRSLSCQLMGSEAVLDALKRELGTKEHGTSKDGQFALLTEECLAACDFAPCVLVGEKLHKSVKSADVKTIIKDAKNAVVDMPRSDLYDAPAAAPPAPKPKSDAGIGKTSDIDEMKNA